MFKNLSRILTVLLLLSAFTAGAAQAAPRFSADPEISPLTTLLEWVTSWFELATVDEGCEMDPNDGGCRNGSNTDEGSHMDPNG